jgi:hypothetical protein
VTRPLRDVRPWRLAASRRSMEVGAHAVKGVAMTAHASSTSPPLVSEGVARFTTPASSASWPWMLWI